MSPHVLSIPSLLPLSEPLAPPIFICISSHVASHTLLIHPICHQSASLQLQKHKSGDAIIFPMPVTALAPVILPLQGSL